MLTVLLDMDEVITDFVGAALREHGWTRHRLEKVWTPGTWSIVEPMEMTQQQFWAPIKAAGTDFWAYMNPTPWAEKILGLMSKYDWMIVTSPSKCAAAGTGKIRWIKQQLGEDFEDYVITPCKSRLARPDYVLIDDREETVKNFVKAGGRGIVFPSRHNFLHECSDPVQYVKYRLEQETRQTGS
ncbi:hypothetical protein M0R72_07755 [Candidatus Pacearchaeota archaeon]|jgi:5'(3')-deoxyribonucleotidase|nr:hypothetical protein [Candidatus Pacearchaeota archaeon]